MAQPVAETATDQKDFALHRIVCCFCNSLIRCLPDQQNVDRRHHGHQSHVSPSHHPRRQARRGHTVT
jgi:hypothetical protein